MKRSRGFRISDKAVDAGYVRKSDIDWPPDCRTYEQRFEHIENLRRVRVAELVEDAQRLGHTIHTLFDDMGISARGQFIEKRAAFSELRAQAFAGGIRRIWARDLSRLFRDLKGQEIWFGEMFELGVEVFLDGQRVTADPESTVIRQLFGAFNQWRAENDAARVREDQLQKLKLGQSVVRHRSVWGLKYIEGQNRFEYDPSTADKILDVFETFAGCQAVAHRTASVFNDRLEHNLPNAFRTPGNTSIWTALLVTRLIGNALYRQSVSYKENTPTGVVEHLFKLPDRIPEVIPHDLMQRVDLLLEARKPAGDEDDHPRKAGPMSYTYSGLLRCGYCGGPLYGAERTHGGKIRWRCIRKARYNRACEAHELTNDRIDALIGRALGELAVMLANFDAIRQTTRRRSKTVRLVRDKNSLAAALATNASKRDKWLELYVGGLIGKEDLDRRVAQIDAERKTIEAQMIEQPEEPAPLALEVITPAIRAQLAQNVPALWGVFQSELPHMEPVKRELLIALGARIEAWAMHRDITERTRLKYERLGIEPKKACGERNCVRLEIPRIGLVSERAITMIETIEEYHQGKAWYGHR